MPDLAAPTDFLPASPNLDRVGGANPSKETKGQTDLREADVVSQVLRYREEAWHRDYAVRDKWLQCYQIYRNHQDFSDKAPWQSRLMLSKSYAAVKQFVANIFSLLMSSEQWISVDPADPDQRLKLFSPLVESCVLKLTDSPRFRTELRDTLEFGGGIGVGVVRIDWAYDERNELTAGLGRDGSSTPDGGEAAFRLNQKQRKEGFIKLTSIDPFHVWWGPRTKGGRDIDWIMEESYADIAMLKSAGTFQNLDKIWGDTPDQSAITRSYEQQRKDKRIAPETTRKQIHLLEYWGDLVDTRTNKIAQSNRHIIVANRTTIIKNEENPYWDRKPPYIVWSPLVVAGRWPGQGILEINLPILNEINNIGQKMADHLSISVVPMFEVEATALENPEGDMQTGIQPGKVFYRKSGAGMQAVMGIPMPQLPNATFNFQLAMDKEVQRGTFITEIAQGLTDQKGETTATEVTTLSQHATMLISDIARYIEDMLLAPLAETVWSRAFQFIDGTSKPTWAELVGPELGGFLDQLPREIRIPLIQGRYAFKAHGLSRAIQRQQNIQKYMQFLQSIGTMAPQLLPLVHVPSIMQRIFEGFHFPDPHELLPENVEEMFKEMQQALVNQQNPVVAEQAKAAGAAHSAGAQGDEASKQALLKTALAMLQGGAAQTGKT